MSSDADIYETYVGDILRYAPPAPPRLPPPSRQDRKIGFNNHGNGSGRQPQLALGHKARRKLTAEQVREARLGPPAADFARAARWGVSMLTVRRARTRVTYKEIS